MNYLQLLTISDYDIEFIYKNWVNTDRMLGQSRLNMCKSESELEVLVSIWNENIFQGKYFEVFLIMSDDKHIGLLSLYEIVNGTVSIGVTIDKLHWNKGYGTGAVKNALQMCKDLGYSKVESSTLVTNIGSIRMHEKNGFQFVKQDRNVKGNICNYYKIEFENNN